MRENVRKMEAMVLSSMISSIDNMDRQFSECLFTSQDQKQQLIEAVEQCRAVGGDPPDLDLSLYQVCQDEAEQALVKVAAAKDEIITWARDVVMDFELNGASALNTARDIMDIYNMLEELRKQAIDSAWNMVASTDTIRGQMVSAIRAVRNKELSPLQAVRKLLSGVNHAVFAAIRDMKYPEQTAEAAQEAQIECQTGKKPSVRQALAEKKAEAARSASAPEKEHKSKEASL